MVGLFACRERSAHLISQSRCVAVKAGPSFELAQDERETGRFFQAIRNASPVIQFSPYLETVAKQGAGRRIVALFTCNDTQTGE